MYLGIIQSIEGLNKTKGEDGEIYHFFPPCLIKHLISSSVDHGVCYTRSVQKISRHVMWKIETFIEEDTRNIIHRKMTPQYTPKYECWDLTQFFQSPSAAPSYFCDSHQCSEIFSLSKVTLVLGKARSLRAPNLGEGGLSHLGDLMFHQKLHEM